MNIGIPLTFLSTLGGPTEPVRVVGRNPFAKEVSVQKAVDVATSIERQVGFTRDLEGRRRIVFSALKGSRPQWIITFNDRSRVYVDAGSGKAVMFVNIGRQRDQIEKTRLRGKSRFKNAAVAKAHIRNLGAELGLPTQAVMHRFDWLPDGKVKDSNPAGILGATFTLQGRLNMEISIDPQDGELVFWHLDRSAYDPKPRPSQHRP